MSLEVEQERTPEITPVRISSVVPVPDLDESPHEIQAIANVVNRRGIVVRIVGLSLEIIGDTVTVVFLFLRPQTSSCHSANDRVKVIPFRPAIVFQEAAAFEVADGFWQLRLCGAKLRRRSPCLQGLFVFVPTREGCFVLLHYVGFLDIGYYTPPP